MQNQIAKKQTTTAGEWVSLLIILVLWICSNSTSAQSYYCDDLGNCTGLGISTYTDDLGNTTGRLGDDSVRLYSDQLGNTTGNIGDDRVYLYRDDLGNTTGRIGEDRVVPRHEAMQTAQRRYRMLTGAHVQMIGVGEHHGRADVLEVEG